MRWSPHQTIKDRDLKWSRLAALLPSLLLVACSDVSGAPKETVIGSTAAVAKAVGLEPVSGLNKSGLIAVQGAFGNYGVFYIDGTQSETALRRAAVRLCKRAGKTVTSKGPAALHHAENFPPNTKHFRIVCG